jgi:flagellar basal body-associated protein FliL
MVRKVELDLLEETDINIPEALSDENQPAKKGRVEGFLAGISRKKIIGAAILFAVSGIVGVSLLMFSAEEKSPIDFGTSLIEAKVIRNIENLDSFVIDLSDENGQYRVLVCDIAVEMNVDKKISDNKAEVRKKTYNALKSKRNYVLKAAGYNTIKKEMRNELDKILGGGVKEVYFTKYILL